MEISRLAIVALESSPRVRRLVYAAIGVAALFGLAQLLAAVHLFMR